MPTIASPPITKKTIIYITKFTCFIHKPKNIHPSIYMINSPVSENKQTSMFLITNIYKYAKREISSEINSRRYCLVKYRSLIHIHERKII